jgi:hypothetical protein
MSEALIPLVAVLLGGILSIAGGYFSTILIEKQRLEREQKNLALAFRGEVSAILHLIEDRGYVQRFADIIAEMERTDKPFYAPLRVRYQYDSVYRENVDKIGSLANPLPELLAVFYTRMASLLEDFSSLGDGTFASLSTQDLLRMYKSTLRVLTGATASGKEIVAKIDELYGKR